MTILSYLRFALADDADQASFERDLDDMLRLGARQPGYRWAEVTKSLHSPGVYLVVSQWDDVEQVRAWEHQPDHEAVIRRWEDRYREPFLHARFVPWVRPE